MENFACFYYYFGFFGWLVRPTRHSRYVQSVRSMLSTTYKWSTHDVYWTWSLRWEYAIWAVCVCITTEMVHVPDSIWKLCDRFFFSLLLHTLIPFHAVSNWWLLAKRYEMNGKQILMIRFIQLAFSPQNIVCNGLWAYNGMGNRVRKARRKKIWWSLAFRPSTMRFIWFAVLLICVTAPNHLIRRNCALQCRRFRFRGCASNFSHHRSFGCPFFAHLCVCVASLLFH